VIATDGQLVAPVFKENVWIAVAQRLDILFQIPADADQGANFLITAQVIITANMVSDHIH